MKAGSKDHIKIKRLKRALGISVCHAVGIIETLIQVAIQSADDGGIGRYSNEDLAIEIDWPGDADKLVAALLECGWVDPDDELRLVIHDWVEHAPDFIKERLRKRALREKPSGKSAENPDSDGTNGEISGQDPTNGQKDGTNPGQIDRQGKARQGKASPVKPIKGKARQEARPDAVSSKLTDETLSDTAALLAWNRDRLGREPSEDESLFVLSAAERSIERAKKSRTGLFLQILDGDRGSSITNDQEDRARKRLEAVRAGPPSAAARDSRPDSNGKDEP